MYAVIETGGKQIKVAEGETVYVEKLPVEEGKEVVFDKVLAVVNGESTKFGAPYIEGAKVSGKVVKQGRAKKIIVMKFHNKVNYRRKIGHRQPFTAVHIDSIAL